jgi:uncharacterized protein DUF1569
MGKPKTTVKRRKLHLHSLDDILNDAKTFAAPGLNQIGNWTPSQIVGHVAAVIDSSVEGFTFKLPVPVRLLGRLMRRWFLAKGFPAGIKMPGNVPTAFKPPADLSIQQAIEQLASSIDKANQKRMNAASPVLGKINHEQWVQLHCRHAELHFSFLSPIHQTHDASQTRHNTNNPRHTSTPA